MLDLHGELQDLVIEVEAAYKKWVSCRDTLTEAETAIATAEREKDYLLHMQKELSDLAPQENEDPFDDSKIRSIVSTLIAIICL